MPLKSIVSDEFGLAVPCRSLATCLAPLSTSGLVFSPQPITIGLGDRVPPNRSNGPFKTTEHAAAGGIVWSVIGDAQSSPYTPNLAELVASGNPHSSQQFSRLGPKVGQFFEWLT